MEILEFNRRKDLNLQKESLDLLSLLERVNPCNQGYHVEKGTFIVTYRLRMDLLNLWGRLPLKIDANVVGLPISVADPGYLGIEAHVEDFLGRQRGLWVVLNGNKPFSVPAKTLSTFVFRNRFDSFSEYLHSLRSPYRRRIKMALDKGEDLLIRKGEFTEDHYGLYREVVGRSDHPLEILPLEFFREYHGDIYEFRSKEGRLLAFVQTKKHDDRLRFLFCGFRREDVEEFDLYYNMLLWIVRLGIDEGVREIDFGQTSEESKLKIGCQERERYLFIHHHNPALRWMLTRLLPMFSYRSYPTIHRVFKEEYHADLS
ncbi:MAG: GNAT family N-acetyltransferase [Gudongella sp.]|nr:GNAT family N-acetyltransferase [Gudongella sp.]